MFIKTVADAEASGRIAEIYAAEREEIGLVMSATACWTARADLLPLFSDFFAGVKAGFTLSSRDWRLITFIVAREVPSTYCVTVYGRHLIGELESKEAVLAVLADFRNANLSDRDVAMLSFAEKVARNAPEVTQGDIEALRECGFTDPQIADIALCASLRCFMSRFFEATGAGPEPKFIDDDKTFREALTVGRRLPG
jgi:uncharacterized peroxidase-related enzyme